MKQLGGIRNILSAVTDAVVLVDSRKRITFMNAEAEKLTGFSAEDAAGKDIWEVCVFIEQNTRKSVTDDIDEILLRDGYLNFPVATVIITRKEDEILIRGGVFLSDHSRGNPDVIEGVVFRNVSSRWLMDTAMQRNQKAEAIRILAGGIADNLNDLLTVLLARLSVISRNHNDRTAVFRSIRDSKKIIGKISSMISSLSPREDPGNISNKNICLFQNVIRSSLDIFTAAFPDLNIEVAYPDRTGYTSIPPGFVEQIVVNLIMNAGEAVRGDGTISITACRIDLPQEIKPVNAGSYVILSINDNGCGISDENLTRIIDPFYTTKRKQGGLGLSAVYSIVNNYKGYIAVRSKLGEGSSFSVYLPAAPGIVTETASDVIPNVFIAGFEQTEEQLLSRILEAVGCTVFPITAESIKKNLIPEDAKAAEYKLLLTDYDFYMSEIDLFTDLDILENVKIAVINESYHIPDNVDSNIVFIRRPLGIDSVAGAVTKCAWARPVEVMKAGGSED